MSKAGFRDFMELIGGLGQPVAQAGAEAVRALDYPSAFHEARHGGIGSQALAHAGKQTAVTGKRCGLFDDRQRRGR